jgi:predicted nucleotidyltransferase
MSKIAHGDAWTTDIARKELLAGPSFFAARARARGVAGLTLFGSRARGDNRLDSDIDIMIDIEAGRKFSLLDLVGVAHHVEDVFGLPANIFMRRSLDPDFLAEARKSEIGNILMIDRGYAGCAT